MAANLFRVESLFRTGSQSGPSISLSSWICAGLQVVTQAAHHFERLLTPTGTEPAPFRNSASK